MKKTIRVQRIAGAIALTLLGLANQLTPAFAYPETISSAQTLLAASPSQGNPDARRGTINKSGCPARNPPMTSLLPKSDGTGVGGKTVAQQPVLWFYTPYIRSDNLSAEFILMDENNRQVYSTAVRFPEKPGVMSVQIPAAIASLELNKRYRWAFQVKCSTPPIQVEGWVQRVMLAPSVMKQIQTAKQPQQRAALYLNNDIWFDGLTALAERKAGSQNAAVLSAWISLLNQVELSDIASQPIAP